MGRQRGTEWGNGWAGPSICSWQLGLTLHSPLGCGLPLSSQVLTSPAALLLVCNREETNTRPKIPASQPLPTQGGLPWWSSLQLLHPPSPEKPHLGHCICTCIHTDTHTGAAQKRASDSIRQTDRHFRPTDLVLYLPLSWQAPSGAKREGRAAGRGSRAARQDGPSHLGQSGLSTAAVE